MTTTALVEKPATSTDAASFAATTLEEIVTYCARLQPKLAAEREDSSMCVTPLITKLIVDGWETNLKLVDGKWGAGYTRVSHVFQRSAKSVLGGTTESRIDGFVDAPDLPGGALGGALGSDDADHEATEHADLGKEISDSSQSIPQADPLTSVAVGGRRRRKPKVVPDGFSEEEQLARQIRYFASQGWAFRIYSDCGMSGDLPTHDVRLISRLLEGKAQRYNKIYSNTMLDETSRLRRTPNQVASMEAYLAKTLAKIRRAAWTLEQIETSDELCPRTKRRLRSSKKRKAFFRQALTQLWNDIASGSIHTIAVSDHSRLCRAADLESAFLEILEQHGIKLKGLIEDLSSLDVSDPMKKGLTAFIAGVNEYRLEEIAGHAFRGMLQLLENGHPNARLPWWLERDDAGRAVVIEGRDSLVRRIVNMSLAGMGLGAITTQLHDEGTRVDGKPLTRSQMLYLTDGKAIAGVQEFFGLEWPVYPRVVDDETVNELREKTAKRGSKLSNLHNSATWADHLFTGLCSCWCGSPLMFMHSDAYRKSLGSTGTYHCRTAHKSHNSDDPAHAYVAEEKLAAFFGEILRDNPRVLRDAIEHGGDRRSRNALRLSLLDEQFRVAQAAYNTRSIEARVTAEERVTKLMGMQPEAAGYGSIVEGVCENLLEADGARLATLKQERLLIQDESQKDRENTRALSALDDLQGWDNLDIRSKNHLLRAVFASITVCPLGNSKRVGKGGYLEIKVAGSGRILPPIKLSRGPRRGIFLPSAEGWIKSIFDCGSECKEGS